jgi:hypothetical protein
VRLNRHSFDSLDSQDGASADCSHAAGLLRSVAERRVDQLILNRCVIFYLQTVGSQTLHAYPHQRR